MRIHPMGNGKTQINNNWNSINTNNFSLGLVKLANLMQKYSRDNPAASQIWEFLYEQYKKIVENDDKRRNYLKQTNQQKGMDSYQEYLSKLTEFDAHTGEIGALLKNQLMKYPKEQSVSILKNWLANPKDTITFPDGGVYAFPSNMINTYKKQPEYYKRFMQRMYSIINQL